MDHDDFANIEWQNSHGSPQITSPRSEDGSEAPDAEIHSGADQAGRMADGMDLAGVGEGVLECMVEKPIKENDGTKDAFVSYLVTTNVCLSLRAPQDLY
jgi:sorting nexin-4